MNEMEKKSVYPFSAAVETEGTKGIQGMVYAGPTPIANGKVSDSIPMAGVYAGPAMGMQMGMLMGEDPFASAFNKQQEAPQTKTPEASEKPAKKFCPNCGVFVTGKFCPECGAPLK